MRKKKEPEPKKTPHVTGVNFRWHGVDVKYENGTGHCTCEDYCRCSTIVNTRVTNVDIQKVLGRVVEGCGVNEMDLYCIDRILRTFKVWEQKAWKVGVHSGYYGEELGDVTLNQATEIDQAIDNVLSMGSGRLKIEYLLELEYGYLLEALFDCTYTIETLDKTKINFQQEHYTKLDKAAVDIYIDYPHPRGIVLERNGKYRLIDGYHRNAAVKSGPVKVIVARKGE
jgi:hypothetical protein